MPPFNKTTVMNSTIPHRLAGIHWLGAPFLHYDKALMWEDVNTSLRQFTNPDDKWENNSGNIGHFWGVAHPSRPDVNWAHSDLSFIYNLHLYDPNIGRKQFFRNTAEIIGLNRKKYWLSTVKDSHFLSIYAWYSGLFGNSNGGL